MADSHLVWTTTPDDRRKLVAIRVGDTIAWRSNCKPLLMKGLVRHLGGSITAVIQEPGYLNGEVRHLRPRLIYGAWRNGVHVAELREAEEVAAR